jgi:HSP20 family molecular chaperone IbpA
VSGDEQYNLTIGETQMSEETKLPEENVEAKAEEQAEATTVVEGKVEETQPAVEEQAEPAAEEQAESAAEEQAEPAAEEQAEPAAEAAKEKSCCLKSGGHINFWKLATVFLLLAWAVQNWRITKAEEAAKKRFPIMTRSINCPSDEENMVMQDQVMQQVDQLEQYMSMNPRGIAPALEDSMESVIYKMFVPGLKDYKVNVSVKGNVLTVVGAVTVEKKAKGEEGVLISESSSKFTNIVKLPCPVIVDKIKIEKQDNEILVIMPKVTPTPEAAPVKKEAAKKAVPAKK